MTRTAFALTILLFCCGSILAQNRETAEPGAAVQQPAEDQRLGDLQKPDVDQSGAGESWWQKIVREAPGCKSFTDGCRTCSQTVCSNIGIACQPKEWSCNDSDSNGDAKPEATPDATPDSKP